MLFYALCALALATTHVPGWLPAAAWLFVALRIAHSAIQCSYNRVMHRFAVFLAGFALLGAMWAASHVEDVHPAQDRYDDAILRSAQTTRGPVRALAHLRGGSDRGCPPPRAPAGRARGPRGSAPTADPARS